MTTEKVFIINELLTFNNSVAVGLAFGSFCKHLARKSLNSGDHLVGSFNFGGGFLGIRKITLIEATSNRGGCPSANSIAVIAKLHISAL